MLNLNSIMIGSLQPKDVAAFYENVFERLADMVEGDWYGWKVGSTFFSIGRHSKVMNSAKDPSRIMLNFETKDVKKEFERIKKLGAVVIKAPYKMHSMWIATLADPDGNYFQLMTPWKE